MYLKKCENIENVDCQGSLTVMFLSTFPLKLQRVL